jgi:transposase
MSVSGEALVGQERVELAWVRLRQPQRRQVVMAVTCPDDLVSATHPVRLLQAVVERLDLRQFYEPIQARRGVAGRDATDPQLLVALWLYACTRGIGSARELARRCVDSAAFRWLCGGVTVNHRLLSDFRTDHGAALDALFTQVIASLVDKDVVRVSRVSQDGVRVRVGAGAGSFRSEERLEKLLAEARQHVDELRAQVDSREYRVLSARQRAAPPVALLSAAQPTHGEAKPLKKQAPLSLGNEYLDLVEGVGCCNSAIKTVKMRQRRNVTRFVHSQLPASSCTLAKAVTNSPVSAGEMAFSSTKMTPPCRHSSSNQALRMVGIISRS